MHHPFMVAVAAGLARRGIATLRYQFPYMERGARRPDPPQLAQATVSAAVAATLRLLPELPLIGGGKSFGGRMTSQTQAKVLRRGVFDQDRIDVVEPGAKLQLDKKLLAQFPEGYRHLAYLQTRVGLTVNRSRPGLDGPELEALYAKGADWLVGKTI